MTLGWWIVLVQLLLTLPMMMQERTEERDEQVLNLLMYPAVVAMAELAMKSGQRWMQGVALLLVMVVIVVRLPAVMGRR